MKVPRIVDRRVFRYCATVRRRTMPFLGISLRRAMKRRPTGRRGRDGFCAWSAIAATARSRTAGTDATKFPLMLMRRDVRRLAGLECDLMLLACTAPAAVVIRRTLPVETKNDDDGTMLSPRRSAKQFLPSVRGG
jgi:hypothetical protein